MRKDSAVTRAQDKEAKRARGALSCAECRRLKLKCDKTVPCSSCKRRGCAAICPNGSLITGQGTRFVLADTEKLHQKISIMSDRIRQLEDALAVLQLTVTSESHPLLKRDLLGIKSSLELHAAVLTDPGKASEDSAEDSQYIDAFGTLAIRDDGAATFYGRSAGSESLLISETASTTRAASPQPKSASWTTTLPTPVINLANAFPFSSSQSEVDINFLVESYLPPWEEGWRLATLYLEQAPWFFGAVTKRQLLEETLPLWYHEAPRSPPASDQIPSQGSHELALLFTIFCFGALTDVALPPAPDNHLSEHYYNLAKVSFGLEPILERPPSVSTVQAVSLMAIYEGLKGGENSIESTWTLMGIATKLAQSIGLRGSNLARFSPTLTYLDRDCARWRLPPAEVQKRRALFWELFITDCWQSLATGRLATFVLPFVDCEMPADPDQVIAEDGTIQPSFPFWKARFGAECVSAVVQGALTSKAPRYSVILELDRKVRDMDFPKYAYEAPPQGAGLSETMSHFMPTNYRDLTLSYIHRCFFLHALEMSPLDPIKSQYAPSFLAGYRSACDLLASIRKQFTLFPEQIARFWVLWTHAFSSAVMISSVVTRGSRCKVAPAALLELQTACQLFEHAAAYGGRAVKFLPIMRRLQAKAQKAFSEACNGAPATIHNDVLRFSSEAEDHNKDEASVFGGKTHTVTTKAATSSQSRPGTSATTSSPSESPSQSYTTTNPVFAGAHPNLIHELNGFDGHIRAQIQNAYRADNRAFEQTLMGDATTQGAYRKFGLSDPSASNSQAISPHTYQPSHSSSGIPSHEAQLQQHTGYQSHQVSHKDAPQFRYTDHQYHQGVPSAPSGNHPIQSAQAGYDHTPHEHYISRPTVEHHQAPPPRRHQMYEIPREFLRQHQLNVAQSPETVSPSISGSTQMSSPIYESDTQRQMVTDQFWQEEHATSEAAPHYQHHYHQQMQYDPSRRLFHVGAPAEDPRLQETWQSYMYKVGSPRLMLEE